MTNLFWLLLISMQISKSAHQLLIHKRFVILIGIGIESLGSESLFFSFSLISALHYDDVCLSEMCTICLDMFFKISFPTKT
jgi:hypothetical protein